MDRCYFAVMDDYGNFSRCKALRVGCCPEKCKFRKTYDEYYDAIDRSEKRLRDKGLKPDITYDQNGERIMTVKKWGE